MTQRTRNNNVELIRYCRYILSFNNDFIEKFKSSFTDVTLRPEITNATRPYSTHVKK